jgi:vitamin B12 transporter
MPVSAPQDPPLTAAARRVIPRSSSGACDEESTVDGGFLGPRPGPVALGMTDRDSAGPGRRAPADGGLRCCSRSILVVALWALLLGAGGAAADDGGTLEGAVHTSDGVALPHVAVIVEGAHGSRVVTTSPEGSYRVDGLVPGEYTVSVDAPGLVLDPPARAIVAASTTSLDLVLWPAPVREHVTVAAARGEVVQSNLGFATTVMGRERIEERAAPTMLPLFQEVPGAATSRTGGTGAQGSVFLRGGESRFAAVLIDGIPVNQPGGAFDWGTALPFELEQVEVVRGAASSLYGNDALAGVIHLVTRRAGDGETPSLRGEAEAGSFDWRRYVAGTTGAEGAFDWNVGVQRLTTDNEEPNSRFEQTAVAASLGVRFGPQTRGRAVVRWDDSDVGTPGPTAYGRPDRDASFEREDTLVSGSVRQTAGRTAHLASFGYARTEQISLNPIDSGCYTPEWEGQKAPFPYCDFPDPDGFQNQTARLVGSYQADLSVGSRHFLSAGAEVEHETGALGNRGEDLLEPTRTNFGVYAQDRVLLGQRAYVTLGGRVERNGSYGTEAVPRLALALRIREGVDATTLRSSFGMGIKAPSFFESFGESFFAQGNPDLEPERSRTFDLGLEQRVFDGRVRATATAFFSDYRDQIAYTVVDFDTFEGTYVNLGRTRARGLELELDAQPRPWLTLLGQYTFTDAEILESANDFDPIYAEGEPLLRRPRHQGAFTARLRFARWSAGLTVVSVGARADSDFVSIGLIRNPGYARLDARVRVRIAGPLEAWLLAENLTGEVYQQALGYPALPRSVRGGLRVSVGGRGR